MTPEQQRAATAIQLVRENPLKFAEYYLRDPNNPDKKFKARWLQREMLAQRKHRLNTVRAQRGCGKTITLMARILWYAYTHKNARILCIGPYKITVQRIFEELNKQIDAAPELRASLVRRRNNPFEIVLDNGTIIRGQSTNVTSKKGGQSVRGEHPHFIYIDEADYLDDADWLSFVPLFTPTETDVDPPEVWATTTPTGRRSFFYDLCEHKGEKQRGASWKDWWFPARHIEGITFHKGVPFHLNEHGFPVPDDPSDCLCTMVNESWTKEQDNDMWGMLGEQGYYHEIAAWWGDSTASVFPKRLVDNAKKIARKQAFKYIENRAQGNGGFFTAGVDVDEMSATPNICIIEYLPPTGGAGTGNGTYVLRNRYAMARSDTIYTDLERELISKNIAFKFERAYVDKQPGSQTVERLRLAGHYNFEARQFKEHVDIPTADANGHLMLEKQPLKHAMIFVLRRLFEQGRLALSPMVGESIEQADFTPFGEEIRRREPVWDDDLEKTIRNYQVINVTKQGVPEYTGVKDHPLMAMLLAVFAAYELFDDPFSITMPGEVIVTSQAEVPMLSGVPEELPVATKHSREPGPDCIAESVESFRSRLMVSRGDLFPRPFSNPGGRSTF